MKWYEDWVLMLSVLAVMLSVYAVYLTVTETHFKICRDEEFCLSDLEVLQRYCKGMVDCGEVGYLNENGEYKKWIRGHEMWCNLLAIVTHQLEIRRAELRKCFEAERDRRKDVQSAVESGK